MASRAACTIKHTVSALKLFELASLPVYTGMTESLYVCAESTWCVFCTGLHVLCFIVLSVSQKRNDGGKHFLYFFPCNYTVDVLSEQTHQSVFTHT